MLFDEAFGSSDTLLGGLARSFQDPGSKSTHRNTGIPHSVDPGARLNLGTSKCYERFSAPLSEVESHFDLVKSRVVAHPAEEPRATFEGSREWTQVDGAVSQLERWKPATRIPWFPTNLSNVPFLTIAVLHGLTTRT